MSKDLDEILNEETAPIRVLYVSTYIPRKCGIASFTKDLTNAINLINPISLAQIVAMDNGQNSHVKYPAEVKYKIKQEVLQDYKKMALLINKSSEVDMVCIQHEFGIFGGEMGEYICEFAELLDKPIVTVFHTVSRNPDKKQKEIIFALCKKSKYCVVMSEIAVKILKSKYGVNPQKIVTIHHGVPDFPRLESDLWKAKLRLRGKVVMTSVNLLSEWKGIEYGIKAVPQIIKEIPNFIYLVIGETHPVYLKHLRAKYGRDTYRQKLLKMVRDLNIKKHVRFVNKYVSLGKLIKFIGASDFYITPYSLDPQQTTSGSLAYAVGAGKLCISTPYVYAKEMLSGDRGILVPFKNSRAIAKEVISIYNDPEERERREKKAYEVGRTMTWVNVGHLYFHLFKMALKN